MSNDLDKQALDRWITREPAYDGPMGIFEDYGEEDDCEGCNYSPCLCHVPQSERWEGR